MKHQLFIGFGEISIHLLYPFIIPIVRNLRHFILSLLKIPEEMKFLRFFSYFFLCLSKILYGLIEPILLKLISIRNKDKNKKDTDSRIITAYGITPIKDNYTELDYLDYFLIFVLSGLDLVGANLPIVISYEKEINLNSFRYQLKIVVIFFYAFLSYYILSYPLYLHHKCSLLFFAIGFCFILFEAIKDNNLEWYWITCLVFCYLLIGVQNTYEKKLMEYKFISPYKLLIIEGAFGIVLSIIMQVILFYIPCPGHWKCSDENSIENIRVFFDIYNESVFYYIALYMLFLGAIYLLFFLTIKHFTPTHLAVSDIFASLIYWAAEFYYNKQIEFDLKRLYLSGYIIVSFGGLVYNEIIILYCCNLEKNTKKEIRKRSLIDYAMIEIIDTSLLL